MMWLFYYLTCWCGFFQCKLNIFLLILLANVIFKLTTSSIMFAIHQFRNWNDGKDQNETLGYHATRGGTY